MPTSIRTSIPSPHLAVPDLGCTAVNSIWSWEDGTDWDYVNHRNDGIYGVAETRIAFVPGDARWHDWSVDTATWHPDGICPHVAGRPAALRQCEPSIDTPSQLVQLIARCHDPYHDALKG